MLAYAFNDFVSNGKKTVIYTLYDLLGKSINLA